MVAWTSLLNVPTSPAFLNTRSGGAGGASDSLRSGGGPQIQIDRQAGQAKGDVLFAATVLPELSPIPFLEPGGAFGDQVFRSTRAGRNCHRGTAGQPGLV